MQNPSKSTNSRQGMTSEEMINSSSEWTLALDNALLDRLKEFSKIVDTASQDINAECDTLSKDINRLQSRVFNVTNEFLMLSNTQFVENRVQEFEETMESNVVPPSMSNGKIKTKAEKEVELIAKMKEAIQIGVSTNLQSDTNMLSGSQQQDSFPQLKLPHIIGTSKFFSSKYCGLTDDSMIATPIPKEETKNYSPIPTIHSNSCESLPSVTSSVDNAPNGNSSFESKQTERPHSYSNFKDSTDPNKQVDLAKENVVVSDGERIDSSKRNPAISIVDDLNNAFRSRMPPPPEDESESDDDFKPLSGKKLFGDDDDDLFGENSMFASRQNEENFVFGKHTVSNSVFASERSSSSNRLFDDDVDVNNKAANVFDSKCVPIVITESSKCDDLPKSNETKHKIPAGAVPMFGGLPPSKPPANNIKSSADKEEVITKRSPVPNTDYVKDVGHSSQREGQENKFTSHSSQSSANKTNREHESSQGPNPDLHIPQSVNLKPNPKANSLFDDNSDDDLFPSSKLSYNKKSSSNSLFDDDFLKRNSNKSLNKPPQLKSKGRIKHSIFEDSDSGDDLFSSASSSSSKSKEKPTTSNVNQFFKPSLNIFTGRATESLFDDQHEDIFSGEQKMKTDSITSRNSSCNDKQFLKPNKEEAHLPWPNDQPVEQYDSNIVNDNQVKAYLPTSAMHREEVKDNQDEVQNMDDKKKNNHVESKSDFGDSQLKLEEQKFNGSTSDTIKLDADLPDMNKNHDTSDSAVISVPQSKHDTGSPSVIRPHSLQIQSDKLPSGENNSVHEKKVLFSENIGAAMPDTPDGNSNVKSKSLLGEVSSTEFSSPQEVTEESTTKVESEAERTIGKARSSVKSIASSLKINPLALRPGSRPPKNVDSDSSLPTVGAPESVSNESNNLLSNVAKNRPKIIQQRRPPSRKHRKANFSPDSIVGIGEISETSGSTSTVDAPKVITGDQSETTSPTAPTDMLSPSTEEEDIFSIGIESSHHTAYGIGVTSPEEDSLSPIQSSDTGIVVDSNHSVIHRDDIRTSLTDTIIGTSRPNVENINQISVETSRSLPHKNKKISSSTRITLPSSKITQCSDSDSDDLFSSIGRKISQDSGLQKSKVGISEKGIVDLFSEDSLTKQSSLTKNPDPVVKTNISTESTDAFVPHTSKVDTGKLNGQQRANNTTKSLFSDSENENDIFMANPKAISTRVVPEKVENQQDDNASIKVPQNKKGLFDSDSDEDNLFGAKGKRPSLTNSAAPQNVSSSSKPTSAIKGFRSAKTTNLFSDSSDDDIFTSKKVATKSSKRNDSITEKHASERQLKQSSDDIRHHIFDDPLNNI